MDYSNIDNAVEVIKKNKREVELILCSGVILVVSLLFFIKTDSDIAYIGYWFGVLGLSANILKLVGNIKRNK